MLKCINCKLLLHLANVNISRHAQTKHRRVQFFCWGWKKQCLLTGFIYTLIIAYSGKLWISITAWQKHCCMPATPTSVSNAICMKYQRRRYKICVRGLCVKLVKLKINVRLSAEICPPQKLSGGEKHVLHFVQNLLIPKSVARNFDRYGICMKYQRRWHKICVRGLWGKLG